MKRFLHVFILTVLITFSVCRPVSARAETADPAESGAAAGVTSDTEASDIMSFTEAAKYCAEQADIPYEKAAAWLREDTSVSIEEYETLDATYRVLSAELFVTESYHPSIHFYCETNEDLNSWSILSIRALQLDTEYNGISKAFSGAVGMWLRGPRQIEYFINGDFYNDPLHIGLTAFTGGTNLDLEMNESAEVSASYLGRWWEDHYEYCYAHEFVDF